MSRVIVHLDADAFFASVEQASDPKLRGKPIAVGGEKRGIIASASYEARKFGVKTPMPTAQARRLCPKLIVLPGDYGRYEQFSEWMFGYAHDFTPDVEQTSIDEGYFDLTANRSKSPVEIAQAIRRAIQQKLKITVSEGIGSNKLVSAVASKLRKPSAFEEVRLGDEAEFLCPLPNHWLPGIGSKTAVQLNSAGLARIGQIAGTPIDLLELVLGNSARTFRDYARGVDERPLVAAREPQKSYGQQQTFAADLTDEDYAEAVLRRMADELFATLREEGRTIRTLTVKVRYNDMDEDQRSESLEEPTDLETDVYGKLHGLLRAAWKRRVSLRLVSLKLSQVYDGRFRSELALTRPAQSRLAHEKLSQAVDELRQKLGHQAVLRGHDLRLRQPPRELLKASPQILAKQAKPVRHVPLRMHSHYSFLDSTLSPEDIVRLAGESGAAALTDDGNLHGAVPFALAAKEAGVKAVFGVELKTSSGPLLLYVENATGYANLNRLLSAPRGSSDEAVATRQRHPVSTELLALHSEGLIAVSSDVRLARLYPGRFYQIASKHPVAGHPVVACPEVRHAAGERHRYDILQAIRTSSLLQQSHPNKRTGRLHFRSAEELSVVAKEHPDWLHHAREIAERCSFELPFGPPQFPAFHPPDGSTSREFLRARVLEGARRRYPKLAKAPPQLEEELRIIADVGYDEYFLVVWELLQDCRAAGIEWITRGSAADSLVCYCLGISNVCPIRFDL